MRTIKTLQPSLTKVLFEAGIRTPVLLENGKKSANLHEQYLEYLGEVEFFAPDELGSAESLRVLAAEFSTKPPPFGMTYDEFCEKRERIVSPLGEESAPLDEDIDDFGDANQVFNLPPPSRRRVTGIVQRNEPARFYFVPEPDESLLTEAVELLGETA